jgi:hypothetical protein
MAAPRRVYVEIKTQNRKDAEILYLFFYKIFTSLRLCVDPVLYQLALTIPGIRPLLAISRKQRRDIPNLRRKPLALPVNMHRFLRRTGEEFFGSLFSVFCAARRSSSLRRMSRTTLFNSCRFCHLALTRIFRLFCFAMDDLVAIS